MAAGDATAADVPGRYDCVINGKGYVFLDSLESSIPFRTHRAIYGQTQPFVERQNVSNQYGDNAQDFFQTIRQRDWSLGEQQRYFRANADGRYWMGANVDISIPGVARLAPKVDTLTFAASVRACARECQTYNVVAASSTNLYRVNGLTSAVSDLGAHGLGATPSQYGICTDGRYNYISTTTAGTVGVRRWDTSSFSTFSATGCDSLVFVDNTLYGYRQSNADLGRYDTSGAYTSIFSFKSANGDLAPSNVPVMHPYGGKILMGFPFAQEASELWIYDGTAPVRLEVFPENFIMSDMEVLYGVAYMSGSFIRVSSSTTYSLKPAILFWDGSQIGLLWKANDFNSTSISSGSSGAGPHPGLGVSNGRLIFNDDTTGNMMAYDPATGGTSSIGMFTANSGDSVRFVSTAQIQVSTRNQTTGYILPTSTYPSSGYVISSLVDFDSSLPKVFRGVTVEFDSATDGNGGTVDVSYQIGSVSGSFTSLSTGITSGTEVIFPANTTGHSVSIKITINKGTSTAGPSIKSMSIRGAPVMPIYARGEYILDCTNSEGSPRELRDGTFHALTGHDQVANLVTARNSTSPIQITDRVNGTFTGFVDVNDPQGFDVYEIHPNPDNPNKAGSYVVRLTVRGV